MAPGSGHWDAAPTSAVLGRYWGSTEAAKGCEVLNPASVLAAGNRMSSSSGWCCGIARLLAYVMSRGDETGNRVPSPTQVQGWRGQLQSAQGVRGDPGQGPPEPGPQQPEGALSVAFSRLLSSLGSPSKSRWGGDKHQIGTCECRARRQPWALTQQRGLSHGVRLVSCPCIAAPGLTAPAGPRLQQGGWNERSWPRREGLQVAGVGKHKYLRGGSQ